MTASKAKKAAAIEAAALKAAATAIKAAALKAAALKAAALKAAALKAAALKAAALKAAALKAIEAAAIEAAAKECFVGESKIAVSLFITALKKRDVVTQGKLTRIIESTDYLRLTDNNNVVELTRSTFSAKPAPTPAAHPVVPPATSAKNPATPAAHPVVSLTTCAKHPAPNPATHPVVPPVTSVTKSIPPLTVDCDALAIVDILGDIAGKHLDLEDMAMTDIFLDVGSNISVKINGECIQLERVITQADVSMILERLQAGEPDFKKSNRVIFGQTLHRLATVMYDGSITGITIRLGRNVSGLLPVFGGIVEQKNVLICGAPNVGKTTTLREICKYLSRGKCLCLIDTSGEVCGETGNRQHIVGTSRVFRPVDPSNQYAMLLDCVRNHSPDVIAIDELNTKAEVEVCQTIALRSIQMVATVHGNIQDLVFNPMLNKALGGSTEALVSDRKAIDGRKVVMQRSTRPIFDVVINITRTSFGLEYSFIEDVADNVSRIMEGKPIHIRRRRMVDDRLLESREEVLYPCI
jgi:stage III sporulation protein SpoIIIAA